MSMSVTFTIQYPRYGSKKYQHERSCKAKAVYKLFHRHKRYETRLVRLAEDAYATLREERKTWTDMLVPYKPAVSFADAVYDPAASMLPTAMFTVREIFARDLPVWRVCVPMQYELKDRRAVALLARMWAERWADEVQEKLHEQLYSFYFPAERA